MAEVDPIAESSAVPAAERVRAAENASPMAVALARVVSVAARVEPALLRTARLDLLPEADAGAEADLWFGPLVQAWNPLYLTLAPDVLDVLRAELAASGRLDEAYRVIRNVHADAPPAIQLEERVTWLALSGRPDADHRIADELNRVTQAYLDGEREGLRTWAARALPRLPERARRSEGALLLSLGAGVDLRVGALASLEGREERISDEASVLLASLPQATVLVRRLPEAVEIGTPGGAAWPGALEVALPATTPLTLDVEWFEGGAPRSERVYLEASEPRRVVVGEAQRVELTALDGTSFILRPAFGVSLEVPAEGRVRDTLRFRAIPHESAGGAIMATWQWGDGTTGTGLDADHAYRAPGTYTVTVDVRDELSAASQSAVVTVTGGFETDLQEGRRARGLSLDEVHRATRIPVDVIRRFEAGGLVGDVTYGETDLISLIKSYSKVVGLDPAAVLDAYEAAKRGEYVSPLLRGRVVEPEGIGGADGEPSAPGPPTVSGEHRSGEWVQVDIVGLSTSPSEGGAYALVLGEVGGDRRLPIIIGAFEAQAIALELENIAPPRPMTHDLLLELYRAVGLDVAYVLIDDLVEGTFMSQIAFGASADDARIDARPADTVAIAVRCGAPIYVDGQVMDVAGIAPDTERP